MPGFFTFTDYAHIKVSMLKQKPVFRGDLRTAHHNRTGGQVAFDLASQKQASLHVPEGTGHSDKVRPGIQDELKEGLIAAVAHQVDWNEFCVKSLLFCNSLQIARSEWDILIAEEKIMALNRK